MVKEGKVISMVCDSVSRSCFGKVFVENFGDLTRFRPGASLRIGNLVILEVADDLYVVNNPEQNYALLVSADVSRIEVPVIFKQGNYHFISKDDSIRII